MLDLQAGDLAEDLRQRACSLRQAAAVDADGKDLVDLSVVREDVREALDQKSRGIGMTVVVFVCGSTE